jgi:hypothetical protein
LKRAEDGNGLYCPPIESKGCILYVPFGVASSYLQGEVLEESVTDEDLRADVLLSIEPLTIEPVAFGEYPTCSGRFPSAHETVDNPTTKTNNITER